ncbi:hypothetical protein ACIBCA_30515 [Kitasatospora sp. NPDC051170]|uniref:hypothetical protein n=1 Tax=Kitasatospora sp. NPDC051170 TaxID=3364056 RepID=UPI0037BB43AD
MPSIRLTMLAKHALARGSTPAETYALLAHRSRKPLPSARAVCLALDIPLAETTRRLDDCYDALLANPRPNTEADTGEVLEALGIFDIPKQLDDRELAIVDLFLIAIDAMGGIRAGHQHGLERWFTTGNLTTAYLSLTAASPLSPVRRTPDHTPNSPSPPCTPPGGDGRSIRALLPVLWVYAGTRLRARPPLFRYGHGP